MIKNVGEVSYFAWTVNPCTPWNIKFCLLCFDQKTLLLTFPKGWFGIQLRCFIFSASLRLDPISTGRFGASFSSQVSFCFLEHHWISLKHCLPTSIRNTSTISTSTWNDSTIATFPVLPWLNMLGTGCIYIHVYSLYIQFIYKCL